MHNHVGRANQMHVQRAFSILFPPRRNSPFFQFVPPISSSSKKKRKISFFPPSIERILITNSRHARRSRTILRYETSWTRARHHSNTRRKIESQVSRLHRNTRVIFMDGWPAPVPSPYFPETRGSTRPREEIRA